MQGYSLDLRKRVVKAVKEDKQKVKDVAKRFVISIWSVNRYLKLDALGDLEAKQPSGRRRRLDDQGLRKLENQVKKHKDWTLEQHAQALEETTGISLKKSAIGVYFKRLGVTIKKDVLPSRAR